MQRALLSRALPKSAPFNDVWGAMRSSRVAITAPKSLETARFSRRPFRRWFGAPTACLENSALREGLAQAETARCHFSHCWSVWSKPELRWGQSMRKVAPHTQGFACIRALLGSAPGEQERSGFVLAASCMALRRHKSDYAVIACPCHGHGQTKNGRPEGRPKLN